MFGRTKEEPPPQARLAGTSRQPAEAPEKEPSGPREGLILLLFTIVTLAATGYVLASQESNAVDDPAEKAARGEINGLDELSLLRGDNLRQVLDEVEGGERPLVLSLRIAAARADVTVRDADGFRKVLTFDPAFDNEERDYGVGEDDFLETDQIDAAAPERIARAVAKRTGQSLDAVDYVTRSASSDDDTAWYLSLDEGPARDRQWVAAADGSDIRKPGEPSAAQRAEQRRSEEERRRYEAEQRRIQRLHNRRSACLQAAKDSEAASRCIEKFQL